ncbi:hypothetical protein C0J26_23395 [Pseudomonas baetica]|nr:hypothetical protein C0J26_23395 [Pseudomonas baetica]
MPCFEIVGCLREKLYTKLPPFQCRSEPARECAGSISINVECDDLFASRLAPTLDCVVLLVFYSGSLSIHRWLVRLNNESPQSTE